MKKLLELGNDYAANSDWTDFALAKFCLCAMGILIGIGIPVKKKKISSAIQENSFTHQIQNMLYLRK